ncbi:MAG: PQQ-binding-like beta-propeller repeat protein [Acidimicrobiales bacterium]
MPGQGGRVRGQRLHLADPVPPGRRGGHARRVRPPARSLGIFFAGSAAGAADPARKTPGWGRWVTAAVPRLANGQLYVGTADGRLVAYSRS